MVTKINSKIFKEFIEKVSLKGAIPEFMLEVTESGIEVKSMTMDNVNAVIGYLNKESFTEFDILQGQYGVGDSNKLINILSTFTDEVSIQVQDNLLILKNQNKEASFIMKEPEFITETKLNEVPEMFSNFDKGSHVSTDIFHNALKSTSILNNNSFTINIEDEKLYLTVGEKNFDRITEKCSIEHENVSSEYDIGFKYVIPCLTDHVFLSIEENYSPAEFICQTSDYTVKFITAPVSKEK